MICLLPKKFSGDPPWGEGVRRGRGFGHLTLHACTFCLPSGHGCPMKNSENTHEYVFFELSMYTHHEKDKDSNLLRIMP